MGTLLSKQIDTLPAGRHSDGDGLYLQVTDAGTRSWVFRFTLLGKTREMGLGAAGTAGPITLKAARELRDDARTLKAKGIDPLAQRQQGQAVAKAAAAPVLTFALAAERFIEAKGHGKTEDHVEQITSTLTRFAYPLIGNKPLTQITRAHVIEVLRPIWHTLTPTALRVRQRIWGVFENAFAHDETLIMRNPADLAAIETALGEPETKKVHYAAMDHAELPGFLAELRARRKTDGRPSISALALELVVLCALRTNEVLQATWPEIDFQKATWTIPAARMKNREPHVVPLSAAAVAVLREVHARRELDSPFVFPGLHTGKSLSRIALVTVLLKMKRTGFTVHGFRATFRTWAGEATSHAREVIEKALSHTVGDETERSYNRGVLLEKRRVLMNEWAGFCAKAPAPAELPGNVVRLKSAAAA